jgi:hypothetical protein
MKTFAQRDLHRSSPVLREFRRFPDKRSGAARLAGLGQQEQQEQSNGKSRSKDQQQRPTATARSTA